MNTKTLPQSSIGEKQAASPGSTKKPYAAPVLEVFGHLTNLTQSGSGLASGDAGTMMP